MTAEEQKAADDAAKLAAEAAAQAIIDEEIKNSPLKLVEAKLAKAEEDRDNYKAVALKRLGKLPGDADFIDTNGTGLTVAEQVRLELLDREIDANQKAEQKEKERILKENAELRLAIKNRPGGSIGSEGGAIVDVKDSTFTEPQLADLRRRAIALGTDPEKFIERAKINLKK